MTETQKDRPWLFRTYAGHSTAKASNALYRGNVEDALAGQVDGETIHLAQEGIGVVAATAPSLGDTGAITFAAASESFVAAMNDGFWLGTAIMIAAATSAAVLLPRRVRTEQVERDDDGADLVAVA